MKYICEVCGYVYDPAVGDPDGGIPAGQRLRTSPTIGYAPSVVSARATSNPSNKKVAHQCHLYYFLSIPYLYIYYSINRIVYLSFEL